MIRTVRELVAPEDVGIALPHEHVLHNVGSTFSSTSDLEIRFEDLIDYRRAPFAHGGRNLMLIKEDEAFRELERLQAIGNDEKLKPLVVDVTVPAEGRDVLAKERVHLAQRLSGLHLLTVTTFPIEKLDVEFSLGLSAADQSERVAKVLETELMFGIGSGGLSGSTADDSGVMFPGAIYQQIDASGAQLGEKEQVLARGLALAQVRTHAPIYLSFTYAEASGKFPEYMAELEQAAQVWIRALIDAGAESKKLIFCHADRWCHDNLEGPGYAFLLTLFGLGVTVLFDMVGLLTVSDVALVNPCFNTATSFQADDEMQEPPPDSRLAQWIAALLKQQPQLLEQILLSTNVQQRIQYRRFGGGGYTYLFEYFQQRLQRQGVTASQWQQMVRTNVVKLLSWYVPPEAAPIPKNYLQCSICGNFFEPIEGEYFTKFTFTYCGTKCLRRHSRQKFAPLQ